MTIKEIVRRLKEIGVEIYQIRQKLEVLRPDFQKARDEARKIREYTLGLKNPSDEKLLKAYNVCWVERKIRYAMNDLYSKISKLLEEQNLLQEKLKLIEEQ